VAERANRVGDCECRTDYRHGGDRGSDGHGSGAAAGGTAQFLGADLAGRREVGLLVCFGRSQPLGVRNLGGGPLLPGLRLGCADWHYSLLNMRGIVDEWLFDGCVVVEPAWRDRQLCRAAGSRRDVLKLAVVEPTRG